MSEIYLNAPIQNSDFDPDERVGKVVPILVADWLRKEADSSLPTVDLWNSACAGYENEDAARRGLEKKYSSVILSSLDSSQCRVVKTDTDEDFGAWTNTVIDRLIDTGAVEHTEQKVFACAACGNAISLLDSAKPMICVACMSSDIRVADKKVLLSHIDAPALQRTSEATNATFDAKSYPPHATILNKRRAMGVELSAFGFEGEVLDPKVSVGMLALYVAQKYDANQVSLVAARANASHNLPQLYGFLGSMADEFPQLSMKQIAKAPVGYIRYLYDEGVINEENYRQTVTKVLPPHLLHMKRDMTPETAERIIFGKHNI